MGTLPETREAITTELHYQSDLDLRQVGRAGQGRAGPKT